MTAWPFRRDEEQRRNRPPRTPRFKIITGSTVVIALAAASYVGWYVHQGIVQRDQTCAKSAWTDVQRAPNGECVGVTDGSYTFPLQSKTAEKNLAKVEHDIKKENDRVQKIRGHETIAFLLPIAKVDGGLQTTADDLEQLEGAYAAQMYANSNSVQGTTSPPIRLLIASSGKDADEHAITDSILHGDVNSSQRLAAVDGISLSLTSTNKEVKTLTRNYRMPVIGSIITGDNFDNYKNLVRVSPSNDDEVQATLNYASLHYSKAQIKRFMLVSDRNSKDEFSQSLSNAFQEQFKSPHSEPLQPTTFDSSGENSISDPTGQEVQTIMGQITGDICVDNPGVVLFAGRGQDLGLLIRSLAGRKCPGDTQPPVTIMAGDAITNMTPEELQSKLNKANNITIDYMGEASGGEWYGNSAENAAVASEKASDGNSMISDGKSGFSKFLSAAQLTGTNIGTSAGNSDGDAMMGYDAALTSIYAIRLADINQKTRPTQVLGDVSNEFNLIKINQTLDGASGPIQFSNYGNPKSHYGSNPTQKVIPILQVQPDGTSKLLALEP